MKHTYIRDFASLTINDVPLVGGKNASLGEMIRELTPKGVKIPGGFAVTADAFRYFMHTNELDVFIKKTLKNIDTKNVRQLFAKGALVREVIMKATFPADLEKEIRDAYKTLQRRYGTRTDVAVRSSATAEDLPGASFAGQQETYLNIVGEDELMVATKKCFASLFTNRAISYRQDKGFDHLKVALSVGVQKMVRSDKAASGVMFTLDTESGFKDVVLINGSWGLGEMIVQGEVIPDEFFVFKPMLADTTKKPIIKKQLGEKKKMMIYGTTHKKPTVIIDTLKKQQQEFVISDDEVLALAKWGSIVEDHYTKKRGVWTPMDLEWAKDGLSGQLYIVQARPETVQAQRNFSIIEEYSLKKKGTVLVSGASVGSKIASGKAHIIMDTKNIHEFKKGEVLVTDMTNPDWEPIMTIASAIVTDKGGRTSHAAIVSRELGIPCIVGSVTATKKIKNGENITIDTTGSDGVVYRGVLPFSVKRHSIKNLGKIKTKIMMNIATPETAFEKSFIPNSGVGLMREEFIIASEIGIHPQALIDYPRLKSQVGLEDVVSKQELKKIVEKIEEKTFGYKDKTQFYVDKLAYGIALIGAAFYDKPVIVRFSDFKTNEYRQLIGGALYEPQEENPMLGWRGASRYYHPAFEKAFALEVRAIKKVREEMGLTNVQVMVPFCRTIEEGKKVISLIEKYGLKHDAKKAKGLRIYVMCEIPSNILLAEDFLKLFDGMSIGSNDLTQLTLGLDRDGNERIRGIGNENNAAVKKLFSEIIRIAKKEKKYIGICGQGPSDMPDLAAFLMHEGIESMSLNPDSVIKTIIMLAQKNKSRK